MDKRTEERRVIYTASSSRRMAMSMKDALLGLVEAEVLAMPHPWLLPVES